jgi:hypothetical protein
MDNLKSWPFDFLRVVVPEGGHSGPGPGTPE